MTIWWVKLIKSQCKPISTTSKQYWVIESCFLVVDNSQSKYTLNRHCFPVSTPFIITSCYHRIMQLMPIVCKSIHLNYGLFIVYLLSYYDIVVSGFSHHYCSRQQLAVLWKASRQCSLGRTHLRSYRCLCMACTKWTIRQYGIYYICKTSVAVVLRAHLYLIVYTSACH